MFLLSFSFIYILLLDFYSYAPGNPAQLGFPHQHLLGGNPL